jgi:hypothetical protein
MSLVSVNIESPGLIIVVIYSGLLFNMVPFELSLSNNICEVHVDISVNTFAVHANLPELYLIYSISNM